jgi:hypothetical protein
MTNKITLNHKPAENGRASGRKLRKNREHFFATKFLTNETLTIKKLLRNHWHLATANIYCLY